MLISGIAHGRDIGTRPLEMTNIEIEQIDALHSLDHARWRASYAATGARKTMDVTIAYLVRIEDDRAIVFGWITADEQAALRQHGSSTDRIGKAAGLPPDSCRSSIFYTTLRHV